ncbi:MAG: hypothetical protein OXC54_11965, partial [Rhodospirillaceae bacterium]|nr:hypothetical protein [Rhodospirillaceae bacterium]
MIQPSFFREGFLTGLGNSRCFDAGIAAPGYASNAGASAVEGSEVIYTLNRPATCIGSTKRASHAPAALASSGEQQTRHGD